MENMNDFWEDLIFELDNIKNPIITNGDDELLIGASNRNGRILFIGDDPELYENEDLKVTSGSSGEFLIKLCDIEEIKPDEYYITTLTKRNCKYRDFLSNEQAKLKELLDMQIALINPQIVVALGSEVANILCGKDIDFNKTRSNFSSWLGDTKMFVTYDVNFVKKSRNDSGKKSKVAMEFLKDIRLLKLELDRLNERA
ncbi:uracil-DNA glycosylase family protein [Fusobacterium sp. PH5-44]|uniref:uracil-DNA glycosylase family protein n=1 Tax=unclassified Fusobacterium TaxID=2648384 RepID=UPI003D1D4E4E